MQTLRSRSIIFASVLIFLPGCDGKKEYDKYISKQGYIPFQQPLADIGVGALIRGTPKQLSIVAPKERCFPSAYNGIPTEIRQVTATDLPEIAKNVSLQAGADANAIAANGTPLFKMKASASYVKTVDVHVEGASIEYLDEIIFTEWVNSYMSQACVDYLARGGTFVRQALRVDKMSFQFKDKLGGYIGLTADKVNQILDIEAHVQWEISSSYTLTIKTPKYIGYHIAKVDPDNPAFIAFVASSIKDGKFDFKSVNSYKSHRGLMQLR